MKSGTNMARKFFTNHTRLSNGNSVWSTDCIVVSSVQHIGDFRYLLNPTKPHFSFSTKRKTIFVYRI